MDVKQSKLSFGSFATARQLYSAVLQKWQLSAMDEKRLILRVFDKDFDEYVDIEENFALVSLENMAKYELIHRVSNADLQETKNNNVSFENENLPKTDDLQNMIKDFQESVNRPTLAKTINLAKF